MARGGYRPGAGRPKGAKTVKDVSLVSGKTGSLTPLEYMLRVMNDSEADPARRDRMAQAAAPFVHARAGETGKKAQAEQAAQTAERGTNWSALLQ